MSVTVCWVASIASVQWNQRTVVLSGVCFRKKKNMFVHINNILRPIVIVSWGLIHSEACDSFLLFNPPLKQGIHRYQTPSRYRNAASTIWTTAAKRDVIHKTRNTWLIAKQSEEDQATTSGDLHTKVCDNRSCGSRDMLVDRQTDRQTGWSQYSAPVPGWTNYHIVLG